MAAGMRTEITHTVNVVQKERGYFGGSEHLAVVTKYVIKVSLGGQSLLVKEQPLEWQVARRYSSFRSNHAALAAMFSSKLPRLPPKKLSMDQLSSASPAPDPELVASRMVQLDAYLKQLLAIPGVSSCTQMRTFLGAYQGMQPAWFEEVSMPRITPLDLDDGAVYSTSPGPHDAPSIAEQGDNGGACCCAETSAPSHNRHIDMSAVDMTCHNTITHSESHGDSAHVPLGITSSTDDGGNGARTACRDSNARNLSKVVWPVAESLLAGRSAGDGSQSTRALAPEQADPPPLDICVPGAASDASAARAIVSEMGLFVSVDAFATQFASLGFQSEPDKAAGMAQRFLNGMEAAIAIAHPEGYPDGCTEAALWRARDALEDRLLHRLHDHVFGVLPDEVREDERIASCLTGLASVLHPSQLDVPPVFCDTRFNRWDAAIAELRQMALRRTARAKMDCVMQCVLQLKQGLLECLSAQGGRGALGADELFPVFVYVVLQCNPPHLASTLAYVQRFRSPMALKSEAGCYFTHLQAAASFLQSLSDERQVQTLNNVPSADTVGPHNALATDTDISLLHHCESTTPEDSSSLAGSLEMPGSRTEAAASPSETATQIQRLSFSRLDLAQRRSETVDFAASQWEQQIETLIGSQAIGGSYVSQGGGDESVVDVGGPAEATDEDELESPIQATAT